MKYLILGLLCLVIFMITSISVYLSPDDIRGCETPLSDGKCQVADAIVAVSGGDTNARADHAIALYKKGWASKLVFSGAAADPNGPSNAEAMARRAFREGVPDSAIITESLSRTTAENALNTSKFIVDESVDRVLLVTSAYHQRRASLEFSAILGPSVTIINHPVPTDRQWVGFWWWTTLRGWWLAGGELIKIVAFYSAQESSPL